MSQFLEKYKFNKADSENRVPAVPFMLLLLVMITFTGAGIYFLVSTF